jgi:ferredoxin
MTVLDYISAATGLLLGAFFIAFAVSSIREHRPRAVIVSVALTVVSAAIFIGGVFWEARPDWLLLALVLLTWLGVILYFVPLGRTRGMEIGEVTERVDERTTMFAREEYEPGTGEYEQYYRDHPEHKKFDDRLRELPPLMTPGGRFYDADKAEAIQKTFRAIAAMTTKVDGEVSPERTEVDPSEMTRRIKTKLLQMGADEVGVARLNPALVYSHVGRGPEPWGKPIELDHRYAVIYTLEMAYDRVESAPDIPITEESARQYLRAANISIEVADWIRRQGWPARAHISDSNYQVMLPAVAHDAGLGEISRMGYLISRRFGPRVRLGGITTDLPLAADKPVAFGVQDFCRRCSKCAVNCPSQAIPFGAEMNVRGVLKWPLDVGRCIWYWRVAGTDCGLCMRGCPYSHPPTLVHRIARAGIERSVFARMVSVWGDDLFYGRRL